MARKSVLALALAVTMTLAVIVPASATTETVSTYGGVKFELASITTALDVNNFIAPIETPWQNTGQPESDWNINKTIFGAFAFDQASEQNTIPADICEPGACAVPCALQTPQHCPEWGGGLDEPTIMTWEARSGKLYWAVSQSRCDEFHVGINGMPSTGLSKPEESDWVIRDSASVPQPLQRSFGALDWRDLRMENQVAILGGRDALYSDDEALFVYGFQPPGPFAAGPTLTQYAPDEQPNTCFTNQFGNWGIDDTILWPEHASLDPTNDGMNNGEPILEMADLDLMMLNGGNAFQDTWWMVRVAGDAQRSVVNVYKATYHVWHKSGVPPSDNNGVQVQCASQPDDNGNYQCDHRIWEQTQSRLGADCANDRVGLASAKYEQTVTEYPGPLGTVTAKFGTATTLTGNMDVPILAVQDTTPYDPVTGAFGQIDLYFMHNDDHPTPDGNTDHSDWTGNPDMPFTEQWVKFQTIRPHSPDAYYPSSAKRGNGLAFVDGALAVMEHVPDGGQTRAYMYIYEFDDSDAVCDDSQTEVPAHFVEARGKQRLSTEEFVPYHMPWSDDSSREVVTHAPRFYAYVFDQDPYRDETFERDGIFSSWKMDDEWTIYGQIDPSATPTDLPQHHMVCPMVKSDYPQGDVFWVTKADIAGDDYWIGFADADPFWDDNQTRKADRYNNDLPALHYWLTDPEGTCTPPDVIILCFADDYDAVIADPDYRTGGNKEVVYLLNDDEDCPRPAECDDGEFWEQDCRPSKNVDGSDVAEPGTAPVVTGDPEPPEPEEKEYAFPNDKDGDSVPDDKDVCPLDPLRPNPINDTLCAGTDKLENSRDTGKEKNTGKGPVVPSSGPGAMLWVAIAVALVMLGLLFAVARRNKKDEEE